MEFPTPYGRPPRTGPKVDRGRVADAVRPVRHWSKAPPKRPAAAAPDGALDRDLVAKFAAAGRVTFCGLMHGLRPAWAWAAYERCLGRGLLSEDDYTAAVTVTPAGHSELSRGR